MVILELEVVCYLRREVEQVIHLCTSSHLDFDDLAVHEARLSNAVVLVAGEGDEGSLPAMEKGERDVDRV